MSTAEVVTSAASVVTALGVFALAFQVHLTRRQMQLEFEATFVTRYEAIAGRIPLEMRLGTATEPTELSLRTFFDYFELCEQELYYRKRSRISDDAWSDWWEGMSLNLRHPVYREAFKTLDDRMRLIGLAGSVIRTEQFTLLRQAVHAIEAGQVFDPRDSG